MLLHLLRTAKPPALSSPWKSYPGTERHFQTGGYILQLCRIHPKYLFFPQEPLLCDAAAVKNIIAALKLQGKGEYRFPNFTQSDLVVKISKHDSRDIPFAQISYISYLYALRVPSEALLLRRAFRNDDLTNFAPLKALALIAIRGNKPNECLAIRFLLRKNLPQGCILSRP